MKGWATKTIGDVCTIVNGGTPKTNVPAYWDGGHLWITPAEMGKRESPYAGDTARKLTDKGLEDCSAKMLPPLSVILSSRAPIGHLVINTAPMATNQGCKGLIPGKELDHKFLFYYLGSIVDHLNDLGTGATFKELSGGKLKEVAIPFPPLDEQRRIVAVLDEAFAGLAVMRANAEANLLSARALFESHLNAIFSQKGEGWVTEPLNRHVRFIDYRGKTPPKRDAGIRLVTAKNVKMGFIRREPEEFIDPAAYDEWMTRGFPKKGDILFTTEAPLGNVAQLDTDEKVVIGQRLITMQPDPAILDRKFLAFMLMSAPLQALIHAKATGATVLGIKAKLLKLIPIAYPGSLAEQKSIADKIEEISVEVTRLESLYRQKLAAIDELKQSLLQKAFAGELTSDRAILSPALS